MLFGMNSAEWGLSAAIFVVVYFAGFVGRFGEYLGRLFGGNDGDSR